MQADNSYRGFALPYKYAMSFTPHGFHPIIAVRLILFRPNGPPSTLSPPYGEKLRFGGVNLDAFCYNGVSGYIQFG